MDVEFNVAQLMKEAMGAKRKYEFGMPLLQLSEPLAGDPGVLLAHDVQGTIQFTRLRGQIRAQGQAAADVDLQCSRCLEPFVSRVETPLDELFRQTVDVASGTALPETPDEDVDVFEIDHNHMINLTEPVRQALLVMLPMRPLHDDACRGLCPTCGTNLNLTQCDCPTEEVDPRLAGLSLLLANAELGEGLAKN